MNSSEKITGPYRAGSQALRFTRVSIFSGKVVDRRRRRHHFIACSMTPGARVSEIFRAVRRRLLEQKRLRRRCQHFSQELLPKEARRGHTGCTNAWSAPRLPRRLMNGKRPE